ncbi:hypothetical protein Acr_26g0000970 [Actinidia rufa]|uniref:Uncharacterized protein n=1 Tax=Actinidia rufa TaxID=165716 RepID=A0A7J0H127_9ERIC|nr:hypothetical protein Acr_26g0000970 [Actinidia rufa]
MSTSEKGGSVKPSKSKGLSSQKGKGKEKVSTNLDYDATRFKAESIITLCQEFMSNIKHKPVTEKGKEKMISWVRGKKLKMTSYSFDEIFGIPCVENPEFEFSDVGIPDLDAISRELLSTDDIWDGEVHCNNTRLKDRGSMPFTELFKRHDVYILIDIIRTELEKPIDRVEFDTRSLVSILPYS